MPCAKPIPEFSINSNLGSVHPLRRDERRGKKLGEAPISRVFAYEWQAKGLRDRECVRVAEKGLTGGHFCVSAQKTKSREGTPTPGDF